MAMYIQSPICGHSCFKTQHSLICTDLFADDLNSIFKVTSIIVFGILLSNRKVVPVNSLPWHVDVRQTNLDLTLPYDKGDNSSKNSYKAKFVVNLFPK